MVGGPSRGDGEPAESRLLISHRRDVAMSADHVVCTRRAWVVQAGRPQAPYRAGGHGSAPVHPRGCGNCRDRRGPRGATKQTWMVVGGWLVWHRWGWRPRNMPGPARAGASPSLRGGPEVADVPTQWTLGQVAGLAVDSRDHVWIIQRPWSLESDEKAQNPGAECCTRSAASHGIRRRRQLHPGLGRARATATSGRRTSTASTSTTRTTSGSRRPADRACAKRTENLILKFTRDGKVPAAGRPARQEQGEPRHRELQQRRRHLRVCEDQRGVRRRRLREPARHGPRRRHRRVQTDVGRLRQPAGRRRPNGRVRRPGPQQFNLVHGVRVSDDGLVYVADR